jgi:hypothetical protein
MAANSQEGIGGPPANYIPHGWRRLDWQEADLALRRKSAPAKFGIARFNLSTAPGSGAAAPFSDFYFSSVEEAAETVWGDLPQQGA